MVNGPRRTGKEGSRRQARNFGERPSDTGERTSEEGQTKKKIRLEIKREQPSGGSTGILKCKARRPTKATSGNRPTGSRKGQRASE